MHEAKAVGLSVALPGNRSRVVFKSFFTTTFVQQDIVFLCFHRFFVSVLFSGPFLLYLIVTEPFLPLVLVCSCFGCLVANLEGSTSYSDFNNSIDY